MVILGLGSNKGDRTAYLNRAIAMLEPVLEDMKLSRLYETQALLPKDAPLEWNMNFLNMAVAGQTKCSPAELFKVVKAIEKEIGRNSGGIWAPREIDIDILAMGDIALNTPELSIPHRGLLNRDFALLPLVDVAPDWQYPTGEYRGQKAIDIAAAKGYHLQPLDKEKIAAHG